MAKDQVQLLKELAEELKSEPKDKDKALATLVAAKILTKKGHFTRHYPNLKRVVAMAK